jgi:hypothetical protein
MNRPIGNQIRSIVRCFVLLLVVTLSLPIAALRAASDPSWTIKVVAKDSALPVPQAKIIIYPGGKERGGTTSMSSQRTNAGAPQYPRFTTNEQTLMTPRASLSSTTVSDEQICPAVPNC